MRGKRSRVCCNRDLAPSTSAWSRGDRSDVEETIAIIPVEALVEATDNALKELIQSFLREGLCRHLRDDVANGADDVPGQTRGAGDILSERFNAFGLRLDVRE